MTQRDEKTIVYRLGRSVLQVRGTLTVRPDPATGVARRTATAELSLAAEADAGAEHTLDLDGDFWHSREVDVQLDADGRLTGLEGGAAGAGAALIESAIRVGTLVLSTIVRTVTRDITTPEDQYLNDHAVLATQRLAIGDAIAALQGRLAALGQTVANEGTTADERAAAFAELRSIPRALATLRAEAQVLEAHFDAWRARKYAASESAHAFAFELGELPVRAGADDELVPADGELAGAVAECAAELDTIVVRVEPETRTPVHSRGAGVVFRIPRPLTLAVYGADREGDTVKWTRRRSERVWVLDAACDTVAVTFDAKLFNKATAAVELGPTGAIARIGTTTTASAEALNEAIRNAGAAAQQSVEQVAAVSKGLSGLAAAGADERLADLQREKTLLETEIAYKGVLAGRPQHERLARLTAEQEELKARLQIGTDSDALALADQTRALREQLELAKLQLELAKVTAENENAA